MIQPLNVGNIHFYIWNGWNSNLHGGFSIDMPIFDPLPPQLRVLQIDLKVWASPSKWCLDGWRRSERAWGVWKFCMGKAGFSLMRGSWEEAYPKSQKQIFQKPTLPIKLDPLKFVPFNSYWREGGFQNLKGWKPLRKFAWEWVTGLSVIYVSFIK